VVTKFLNAAKNNKDITIYGDGSQTRTFCFINDNIDTTLKILNQNLAKNDILNIGSNKEISIIELAQKIIYKTNSKSKIIHLPSLEEGDMTRRKPDNTRMLQILGKEMISLDEGLEKIINNPKTR
jgi:UDP-glucose 4-epimerase